MVEVSIPIIDDSVVESDEQFTVVLSSSDPNVLTSQNQATVTIVNDDCKFSTPRENLCKSAVCTLSYHNALFFPTKCMYGNNNSQDYCLLQSVLCLIL